MRNFLCCLHAAEKPHVVPVVPCEVNPAREPAPSGHCSSTSGRCNRLDRPGGRSRSELRAQGPEIPVYECMQPCPGRSRRRARPLHGRHMRCDSKKPPHASGLPSAVLDFFQPCWSAACLILRVSTCLVSISRGSRVNLVEAPPPAPTCSCTSERGGRIRKSSRVTGAARSPQVPGQ